MCPAKLKNPAACHRSRSSPNNLLQRSVNHKVLGRGRFGVVLEKVMRARVLERPRAVAEQGRYAAVALKEVQ
jgi:hypothetical protein